MLLKTIKYYKDSFRGLSREVWLLSTVMLINRSGMMVIPFLTLYATQELDYSVVKAGMLTASFGLGSIAGSWIGGWLSDKIGPYKVMTFSLFAGGLGLMSLALFKQYWPLMIAIFLVSTIADALRPAVMSSITLYSKPENRTRSISLLRMAINLGISIGPAIGGIVAGTIGYTWLFLLDGITCLVAAGFLVRMLPPIISKPEEKKDNLPPIVKQSAYRDHIFLIFVGINLINLIAFFQILSTVPLFFEREWGLSEIQIGLFFTLNGLIIFLFEMPLIFMTENLKKSMFWVTLGAAMIGMAHFTFNFSGHWLLLFLVYSLLVGVGEILNFPYSNTWALNRGTGKALGQYMGAYTMMFSIAFFIAPILGTRILDSYGFTTLWYVIGGLNVISVMGFLLLKNLLNRDQ
jgi:MFS family permease